MILINKKKLFKKWIFIVLCLSIIIGGFMQCDVISTILSHSDKIVTGIKAVKAVADLSKAYNKEYSPMEEYYIGRATAAYIFKNKRYPPYGNGYSELEKYIAKIGNSLAMASGRPDTFQGYRFIVINNRSVNAFAVPSGFIFVTTGLIKKAKNEDELAGALAHEVQHIVLKHPIKSISEANRKEAWTKVAKVGIDAATKGNELENLTAFFGKVVDEVAKSALNGYDSKKEKEADLTAVRVLINAGYDPRGLSSMLKKLKKSKKSKKGSIHGDPGVRARDVDKVIAKYGGKIPKNRKARKKRNKRFKAMKRLLR